MGTAADRRYLHAIVMAAEHGGGGIVADVPRTVHDCPDHEDNLILDLAAEVGALLIVSNDTDGYPCRRGAEHRSSSGRVCREDRRHAQARTPTTQIDPDLPNCLIKDHFYWGSTPLSGQSGSSAYMPGRPRLGGRSPDCRTYFAEITSLPFSFPAFLRLHNRYARLAVLSRTCTGVGWARDG